MVHRPICQVEHNSLGGRNSIYHGNGWFFTHCLTRFLDHDRGSINMTEQMHEYKQYPQAWSLPVHLKPHLFIMTTDLLGPTSSHCHFPSCVWPHRKTSDFSLSYQSSRLCVWGYTQHSEQLLCWTLPCCSTPGAISGHVTSWGVGLSSPTTSMRSVRCFLQTYHVTHHSPPPCIHTPISWFLENAMFLPATGPLHMLFLLPQRFSLFPSNLFH